MRDPIDEQRLAQAIAPWRVRLLPETGSTNSDAAEAARAGEPEGLVILAEAQSSGRGRMGRTWVSPPRAGLWLSVVLRPRVEAARWGWLPLLAGVALADTVTGSRLKWPNDLMVDSRKCAGILAEAVAPGAVVLGIGLNVSQTADELPAGVDATSLRLAGLERDRTELAIDLVTRLRARFEDWGTFREDYLAKCETIGRRVRVILPGDGEITGKATSIDSAGRLVVASDTGELCPIAAGDVTHVR